jgi:hypothetical protein
VRDRRILPPRLGRDWRLKREDEVTAAEFEHFTARQAEAVLADRYARLVECGYSPTGALVTAAHVEVDVELAGQLICEGAPEASVCVLF